MDAPPDNPLLKFTVRDLIARSIEVRDYVEAEQQRLSEFLKPFQEEREAISNEIGRRLAVEGTDSYNIKGVGTAYRETRNQFSTSDKVEFLDFCLEDWDKRGPMIQIGAPKVDGVKSYMDDNNGQLPPTVANNPVINIIVRRSK